MLSHPYKIVSNKQKILWRKRQALNVQLEAKLDMHHQYTNPLAHRTGKVHDKRETNKQVEQLRIVDPIHLLEV